MMITWIKICILLAQNGIIKQISLNINVCYQEAKGYAQSYVVEYFLTLWPIERGKTIRILFAITTKK